jgi:hypothetical protein
MLLGGSESNHEHVHHAASIPPPRHRTARPPACCRGAQPAWQWHGDDQLSSLAQFYHLPWLSMRSLMYEHASEWAIWAPSMHRWWAATKALCPGLRGAMLGC